jgi:hypothetical protein
MQYRIYGDYKVSDVASFQMEWNGYSFNVVYGKHNYGWFVAIPNLSVSLEISTPDDVLYNGQKISREVNGDGGKAIAQAIREHFNNKGDK